MESNLPFLIKIVHNVPECVKMVFCLDNDVKRVYDTKFAPPAVKDFSEGRSIFQNSLSTVEKEHQITNVVNIWNI